jgi:hypothetical protein
MKSPNLNSELALLVSNLEEDAVLKLVQQRINAGDDPLQVIDECNYELFFIECLGNNGISVRIFTQYPVGSNIYAAPCKYPAPSPDNNPFIFHDPPLL